MEEIPADVRERVEKRYVSAIWKLHVCAEPDGERCWPGLRRVASHDCEAARRHAKDPEGAPPPLVVYVEVVPRRIETE